MKTVLGVCRRYILTGLTVFLPVLLTVYIIVLTFNFVDGFLGKFIRPIFIDIFGFYFRGISIVVFIFLLFLIGFFVTNFLGKKLYPIVERLLLRIPLFRQLYPAMKEIAVFLFSREKPTFQQVVLVEYPRKGIYAMGFLVNDSSAKLCEKVNKDLCNVLIPTSPSPFSGFVALFPRDEIISTDITVEQAIKFLVSDGVVNPM